MSFTNSDFSEVAMIASKFGLGQQVRHQLLGYSGVIVDVDPVYSLTSPALHEIDAGESLGAAPWYHVVMEDDQGQTVHTYLAEAQLSWEAPTEYPDHPSLDELATSIRSQMQMPRLRN